MEIIVLEGAELAAFVECWRGYVEVPQRLILGGCLNFDLSHSLAHGKLGGTLL